MSTPIDVTFKCPLSTSRSLMSKVPISAVITLKRRPQLRRFLLLQAHNLVFKATGIYITQGWAHVSYSILQPIPKDHRFDILSRLWTYIWRRHPQMSLRGMDLGMCGLKYASTLKFLRNHFHISRRYIRFPLLPMAVLLSPSPLRVCTGSFSQTRVITLFFMTRPG